MESASSPNLKATDGISTGDTAPMSPDKMMAALDIQNKDSWDSVSAQPSCVICSMTFLNQSKLDRHVKYSSMHATAVKKLEAAKNGGNTISNHNRLYSRLLVQAIYILLTFFITFSIMYLCRQYYRGSLRTNT